MATTLTNPIATVTLAGTAERITLPSKYSWVWVRNDTEGAVYISQADDVGEGTAGTIAVPAGGAARLALATQSFYALGTGTVQTVAANYTDCPFKVTPKGGEQHGDPEVLDKLGEDESGALTYDGQAVGGGGSGLTLTKLAKYSLSAGTWSTPNTLPTLPVGTCLFLKFNSNYRTMVKLTDDVNGVYVAFPTLQTSTPVAEFRVKLTAQASGDPKTQLYATLACTVEFYKVEGIVENEN